MQRKRPTAEASTVFASTSPEAPTAARVLEDLPNLPGYECRKLLGQGGVGSVYLAEQHATGRSVAVKVMRLTASASTAKRARCLREIRVMAALRHPQLVEILEAGEVAGYIYFAMELCEGGSVGERVRRAGGLLGVEASVTIILSALEGLSFAHEQGYIHRDLKPENILLSTEEEYGAKIADFGLAKSFVEAGLSGVTASGTSAGTLLFMPKEQLVNFKRVGPSTDVWAMAATLYWLLTGETPREVCEDDNPISAILSQPAIPIRKRAPDVPAPLADVIDLALRDTATARPQNAAALRTLLLETSDHAERGPRANRAR
jgi:eukaryotic-like serine/threonine-protein kinase